MKKIILSLFLLSSFLNADDYIHNLSLLGKKSRCIHNDYYFKSSKFYYRYDKDKSKFHYTTSKTYYNSIVSGYKYDINTSVCSPEAWTVLGMKTTEFHFLEALTGLLFGFVMMVFIIYLFISVGKEK